MELVFKDDYKPILKRFVVENAETKDVFIMFDTVISYRTCLGNKEGKGYITLSNNYDKNPEKESLDIRYDSKYNMFVECDYYDFSQVGMEDKKHMTIIEIPKESTISKKILNIDLLK